VTNNIDRRPENGLPRSFATHSTWNRRVVDIEKMPAKTGLLACFGQFDFNAQFDLRQNLIESRVAGCAFQVGGSGA
jgi:hypothetical protein